VLQARYIAKQGLFVLQASDIAKQGLFFITGK
jgi:hypothetical protein